MREWRGVYDSRTGKWKESPKPTAIKRVRRWLEELGMDAEATIVTLKTFDTYTRFNDWMKRTFA